MNSKNSTIKDLGQCSAYNRRVHIQNKSGVEFLTKWPPFWTSMKTSPWVSITHSLALKMLRRTSRLPSHSLLRTPSSSLTKSNRSSKNKWTSILTGRYFTTLLKDAQWSFWQSARRTNWHKIVRLFQQKVKGCSLRQSEIPLHGL